MRRPIIAPAIGIAAGIWLSHSSITSTELKVLILLVIALVAITNFVNRKPEIEISEQRTKSVFCSFFIFLILGYFLLDGQNLLLDEKAKLGLEITEFKGIVKEVDIKKDYVALTIKNEELGYKVLANYYEDIENPILLTGYEVYVTGKPELPKDRRNPHCFDYREYLKGKGICVQMNLKSYEVLSIKDWPLNLFARWKFRFISMLEKNLSETSLGLIVGIVFGDKGLLSEDIYEEFQRLGTAHVLAVSGLHIGIVYGFAVKLTKKRKNKRAQYFTLLFVLLYILMAGFATSTVRAGAMIFLHIIASRFKFRYDLLSAACTVFIINLLINPIVMFSSGFQLSYLAIFTMGVVLHRIDEGLGSTIRASFSIQLGLAPITAYLFNYFSFIAILINIPVIIIAGAIVPLAIILLYLSLLPFDFDILIYLLEILCKTLVWLNDIAYFEGSTSAICRSPKLIYMLLYYGLLFYFCSEWGYIDLARKRYKRIIAIVIIIIMVSIAVSFVSSDCFDDAALVFVDVGQGDCLHIRGNGGLNVLIDSGGSYFTDVGEKILRPYLLKNGCRELNAVFLTHLHLDHCGGIAEIYKDINVKNLYVYEGYNEEDVREIMPEYKGKIHYLKKGDVIELDKDISVEVLGPCNITEVTDKDDDNSMSLILRVNYRGLTVMMTADIDTEGERKLVTFNKNLHSDILKIAHHGSKYSSSDEFLRAVNPDIAVIQVGKNNYGHPSDSVLDKCSDFGIIVYRNDISGAICFYDIRKGYGKTGTQKE